MNEQKGSLLEDHTHDAATRILGLEGSDDDPELAVTVKLMERLHADEIFSTPEESKKFLDSLTYDEFKKWIDLVNGMERAIAVPERGKVSNSYVQSESGLLGNAIEYRPPHMGQREGLLQMAFEKSQTVQDPEVAGLVLGMSINAIHYFDDGNGRTARIAYALLAKGYDGSDESKRYYSELLENTKGREVVNPNPVESGIDKMILREMFDKVKKSTGFEEAFEGTKFPSYISDAYPDAFVGEYSPSELAVSDEIDTQGRQLLYEVIEGGSLTMTTLMASFTPDRVKEFVKTSPDGKRTYIMGSDFLPTLSKEEIIHWWRRTQGAKNGYVKRLINFPDRDDASAIVAKYVH